MAELISQDGAEIITARESLRCPESLDIEWISTSVHDFRKTSGLLTNQKLTDATKSSVLSPSQQDLSVDIIS